MFVLEQKSELPSLSSRLELYRDSESGLRVLCVPIPGPLCSATIVLATEAADNRGLPHTLEHLVFLGCRSVPFRGFLDTVANRCLATGTNAWTAVDHTAYTVSVAGSEGFLNILPLFIEHVLSPTLDDASFVTEIYHIDGEGKQQGVVFCEMQGRENTEGDLRENALRSLLFDGSPYVFETGGLTPDIAKLTNEQIKAYHGAFYRPDNCTVIAVGCLDPSAILAAVSTAISQLQHVSGPALSAKHLRPNPWSCALPPLRADSVSKTVPFPSADQSVGSLAIGWRGPPIEDVDTCLAAAPGT